MARPANTDAAVTRERILDAALDLFAERGFYGTTMRQIGAAAGITGGALYHHFRSKEAILLTLVERTGALVMGQGPFRLPGAAALPPLPQLLRRIVDGILDVFDLPVHKKFFRIMMADGLRLAQQGMVQQAQAMEPYAALSAVLERLMDEGAARRMNVDVAVLALLGPLLAYRQLYMVWGVPRPHGSLDRAAFVEGHVDGLARLLSPAKENKRTFRKG